MSSSVELIELVYLNPCYKFKQKQNNIQNNNNNKKIHFGEEFQEQFNEFEFWEKEMIVCNFCLMDHSSKY